jgi:hypothetical protein
MSSDNLFVYDKEKRMLVPNPNLPSNIPANSNSIANGATDPTPEAGRGGTWRAIVSWLKGWRE